MSDSRERLPDGERAGLYVLGVLDAAEMVEVRRAAMQDDRLADDIAAWEARLVPLAALAGEETPPPELWDVLMARLEDSQVVPIRPRPAPRALAYWRAAAIGAMAVAASLAGVVVWKSVQPRPRLAMIMPMQQTLGGWLIELEPGGGLRAIAQGSVRHAADRDFELWALAENAAKPVPLGLLPAGSASAELPAGALPKTKFKLLVSLEPKGGSPTSLPTGPVMFAGDVIEPKI
jgi:anti-sigma-K factor RskA